MHELKNNSLRELNDYRFSRNRDDGNPRGKYVFIHSPASPIFKIIVHFPCKKCKIVKNMLSKSELKNNRYEVLHGTDLSLQDVEQIIELDRMSLDSCYQVTAGDDYALLKKNRENGIVIRDRESGLIVGYSMLLPIHNEMYEKIRTGTFIDTEFRPEMTFVYDKPGIYHLYFASVVIHEKHRSASLVLTMMDAMVQDFIDLTSKGIFFESMIADVVSREGIKFCRLFGLKEVTSTNHNSKIYEVASLPPMMRITTPTTQRLYDIYRAKFADEYGEEVEYISSMLLEGNK